MKSEDFRLYFLYFYIFRLYFSWGLTFFARVFSSILLRTDGFEWCVKDLFKFLFS